MLKPASSIGTLLALFALISMSSATAISHLAKVNVSAIQVDLGALNASVVLTVSSTQLSRSGEFVTVSYSGFANPSGAEWIGLYLEDDNVVDTAPISYQFADYDPSYNQTGSGSLNVQLVNMRANMVFYFFIGGLDLAVAIAKSDVIQVVNINEPLQGRLSLSHNNEVLITWTTKNCTTPTLQWGTVSGTYTTTVPAAETTTYTQADMCGAPATTSGFRDPGIFHTAVFTGLQPNQRIYYRFGDGASVWSSEFSFLAPPGAGGDVNIIAFGDLGQAPVDDMAEQAIERASKNTTTAIYEHLDGVQLITHIGDISYARGYVSQWEFFHNQIENISAAVPWMTAIGNHERDWPNSGSVRGTDDSGGECGVAYETRFVMPTRSRDDAWYSFNFGVVHYIIISTEHAFAPQSPQHNFVKQDLEKIDRSITPWVIFAGHRPYIIDSTNWEPNSGDQTVAVELRAAFEDLLYENKVDLIFGAHHHSYQRTCPVYQGACMTPGSDGYAAPVIVDLGMAGYDNSVNLEATQPAIFEIVNDSTHGFMKLQANQTHLTMQYVEGAWAHVLDEFTLIKPTTSQ